MTSRGCGVSRIWRKWPLGPTVRPHGHNWAKGIQIHSFLPCLHYFILNSNEKISPYLVSTIRSALSACGLCRGSDPGSDSDFAPSQQCGCFDAAYSLCVPTLDPDYLRHHSSRLRSASDHARAVHELTSRVSGCLSAGKDCITYSDQACVRVAPSPAFGAVVLPAGVSAPRGLCSVFSPSHSAVLCCH